MKLMNIGVPKTGTVYFEASMIGAIVRHHYEFTDRDWSSSSFTKVKLEDYEDAFKVAFVRNPFDMLVSHFCFLRRPDVQLHHYDVGLTPLSFRSWLHHIAERVELYPQRDELFFQLWEWRGGKKDKFLPDYLGRFETLESDLVKISELTGVKYRKGKPKNDTSHQHYSEFYDEELYALVEERWGKELKFFGYDRYGVSYPADIQYGVQRPI